MILPNMNDIEIKRNFRKDKPELDVKTKGFWDRTFRRACLKTGRYPFKMTTTFKTKAGNKYLVNLHVHTKSDFKNGKCGVAYSLFLPKGKFPECVTIFFAEDNSLLVEHYPAHFMQRYRERMGLEGSNEEIIKSYVVNNTLGTYKMHHTDEEGYHFTVTTEQGVGYGVITNEGNRIVKTFIPHNDLNKTKTLQQVAPLRRLRELQSKNIY